MNWDIELYDDSTDTPTKVKSLDLNEELGSVDHVFSDKTGTLTCNVMEFMKCSIGGKMYGLGITEVGKNVLLRAGRPVPDPPVPQLGDPRTTNVNFVDPDMWRVLRGGRGSGEDSSSNFNNVEEFCLHLSLNHDVAPERGGGDIIYSASSPDESALVSAARHFGYFFYGRSTRTASIRFERGINNEGCGSEDIHYEILHVLPFSSKRKRSRYCTFFLFFFFF
jgi:magnesium-transporting ATPase (P-type)